jgi:hypothetical protein
MSSLRSRVNEELRDLIDANGTLKQGQVVEAAREKGTALYQSFDKEGLWNDSIAAKRARMEYAGQLIRCYRIRITEDQRDPVRAIVSLIDDRSAASGRPGYRRVQDVLTDSSLRANMVETALMELRAFRRKYELLQELSGVWTAMDAVQAQRQIGDHGAEQAAV